MGTNTTLKNNIKIISLIIITLFILYLLHVAFGSYFDGQSEYIDGFDELNIVFKTDHNNKTLTVVGIYPEGRSFYWPEIIVVSGSAQLPFDTINVGDIIFNCEGHLVLKYNNTGATIWEGDFN